MAPLKRLKSSINCHIRWSKRAFPIDINLEFEKVFQSASSETADQQKTEKGTKNIETQKVL